MKKIPQRATEDDAAEKKEATSSVMIVRAKCSKDGADYAILFRKMDPDGADRARFAQLGKTACNGWLAVNTFKRSENHVAPHGAYQSLSNIFRATDFPGCPHCRSDSFTLCNVCNKVMCMGSILTLDNGQEMLFCPTCDRWAFLGYEGLGSIDAKAEA